MAFGIGHESAAAVFAGLMVSLLGFDLWYRYGPYAGIVALIGLVVLVMGLFDALRHRKADGKHDGESEI